MKRNLIQVISTNSYNPQKGESITNSLLSNPLSLDSFEINIIDLNHSSIWVNYGKNYNKVQCFQDLRNLATMIQESSSTKIVVMYPQNQRFRYNSFESGGSRTYCSEKELKNMLSILTDEILGVYLKLSPEQLLFENNVTKVGGLDLPSSFYFKEVEDGLTKSIHSNKVTSYLHNNMILTTLSLRSEEEILVFLKETGFMDVTQEIPNWITNIRIFNDDDLYSNIEQCEKKITDLGELINQLKLKIDNNNKYKSILYSNGDELVSVVFEILEQLCGYNLNDFDDIYREDFIIKLTDITFIGEIKGVTSNVKSEHISQLDVHYQSYLDDIEEQDNNENVKSLLIICHQRKKEPKNRKPVHSNQIKLANRNKSLIIETTELLRLFELYRNGAITREDIISSFTIQNGLFKLED